MVTCHGEKYQIRKGQVAHFLAPETLRYNQPFFRDTAVQIAGRPATFLLKSNYTSGPERQLTQSISVLDAGKTNISTFSLFYLT
jgi:hypothetical protein